jgi:hypothetical protein
MTELDIFKDHNRGLFDLYIFPLYQRISAEKLRCRPDPRLNSVAWNLWHTTRAEDLGLNRLITRGMQVLDEGHWNERLNLSHRHIGTGMTKAEVSDLSARIDLFAMYEYQQAVHAKTASIVDSLTKEALAEKLDTDLLTEVLQDGESLHPDGGWVYDVYLNQTKGWLLFHLGVNHHYFHLADSFSILSLMDN